MTVVIIEMATVIKKLRSFMKVCYKIKKFQDDADD